MNAQTTTNKNWSRAAWEIFCANRGQRATTDIAKNVEDDLSPDQTRLNRPLMHLSTHQISRELGHFQRHL